MTTIEVLFHYSPDGVSIRKSVGVPKAYSVLDPHTLKATWLEHVNPKVDVVVLEIIPPESALALGIEQIDFDKNYEPSVGDEVFVVGFPRNLTGGTATLPLWKGGSIASEPLVDFGEQPVVLIDSDTYDGMSGSPVIARHHGILGKLTATRDVSRDTVIGTVEQFLGVYSGRVKQLIGSSDEGEEKYLTTKFGRVWKARVIDEIIKSPKPGELIR